MIHALCSACNLRARAEKIKKPLFKQTHKVTFHIITSLGVVFSLSIGVRAGGARGAAAPPNFGQLRFFGQREKIWAKPVLKDVSILFNYFKDLNINLKSA